MKTPLLLPTIAIALALNTPAFAETATATPAQENLQSSPASTQQDTQNKQSAPKTQSENHESNVVTINKLKQDLQKAGFTDIKILADSFVVQATDKEGNPTVMSLSPSGVFAISEISQQRQATASNKGSNSAGSETQRR